VLRSAAEADTRAIGHVLATSLRGGERIGLSGELGAGKTVLVRGIAERLGVPPEEVRSPSFPVLIPYETGRLPLYHIDLFRRPAGVVDDLELREYVYGGGVCAIEWFERLAEPLEDFLEISLTFVGTEERRVVVVGHGVGYHHMLDALRAR
jgi:tRNA threonylcarbamoyladenosine biosynthesis protein TsaE